MNKQLNIDNNTITELRLCRALVTALNDELNFTGAIVSKTVYLKLKAVTDFYKEQLANEEYNLSTASPANRTHLNEVLVGDPADQNHL